VVGTRRDGRRVLRLALLIIFVVVPALRAQQGPTPADRLAAGIARLEAGDFLMGLMTLNEVVASGSKADLATIARAHAYRAQANLGLDEPERAQAAALLALKADPSIVVAAPPFSPAVVALFEGLRRPSTIDPETAGLAAEKSARYREAFLAYLSAFHHLPEPPPTAADRRLRERIIGVVRRLPSTPAIPQEARAHFTRAEELLAAEVLLGGTGTASSAAAATELRRAIRIAPWWPEATFTLARVLQKLQRVDEALINLNLYRLADPEGYSAAMDPGGAAAKTSAPIATRAPAAPQVATLYIYWPRGSRGGGKRKVLCDGFHVADLVNRRFVLLNVTPGRHDIKVNNRTLSLSFEAGRPYYLRTFVGGYPARLQFREAGSHEGATELNSKDMRANDPERTYSGECNAGAGKQKR
jgi:tetratricopeptide (TPR) repeat protein